MSEITKNFNTKKNINATNALAKAYDLDLLSMQHSVEKLLQKNNITFNHTNDINGNLKSSIFNLDVLPRIIKLSTWKRIELGCQQRLLAMNAFVQDLYGKQLILQDYILSQSLVAELRSTINNSIIKKLDLRPNSGVYIDIAGFDLLQDSKITGSNNSYFLLEDNFRVPSGAGYILANREIIQQVYPKKVFDDLQVVKVDNYITALKKLWNSSAGYIDTNGKNDVTGVVLTPGPYNCAYFEHKYLAEELGFYLAESKDLIVENNKVFFINSNSKQSKSKIKSKKTSKIKIDIIYRRVEDDFLDPNYLNPTSLIGVPKLIQAVQKNNVRLANYLGTGIADNKSIFPEVPKIIKYYLDEDAILPQIETWSCRIASHLSHVLNNLEKLVVKPVNSAGGYELFFGNLASKAEQEQFISALTKNPANYIAQPLIDFTKADVLLNNGKTEQRRIDLRPFTVMGDPPTVLAGGLSRVAPNADNFVVNSSQGGGAKDTWIIDN